MTRPASVFPAIRNKVLSSLSAFARRFGSSGSILLGLSMIVVIWSALLSGMQGERRRALEEATHHGDVLSRLLSEQLLRSLRATDQTLLYVRESYARDPKNFDISLWSTDSQFLTDFWFQVSVIGADGHLLASNISGTSDHVDLSDRKHFKVHLNTKTDDIYISEPVLGRVSGKWSINVSRKIIMSDGSFGGVVVVSLDPEYLSSLYQSVDVGQFGSIAVVGLDGIVRARRSSGPDTLGVSVVGGPVFAKYTHEEEGSFVGVSKLDNVERIFSYRRVNPYPLVALVGLSKSEITAQVGNESGPSIAIVSLLTLWIIGVTTFMVRYQNGLKCARDGAQAGVRARSEFLAMMSHEIRTPMNGVVGMADILLSTRLDDNQHQFVKTMKASAEHLLQIINDVLDFSKLDANRMEVECIPFHLKDDVVRSTIDILAPRAQEKQLALVVDISPDVPDRLLGDPARLRQILFNLVGNALKFTNAGKIVLRIEKSPVPFAIRFAIQDTGIGIPEDARKLLFREFAQIDNAVARRLGGTGLGLAISNRLVGLLNGTLTVESEVGRGSTFEFTVPLPPARIDASEEAAPEPADAAENSLKDPLKSLAILLVEDNQTNQFVVFKMLESLGMSADLAVNGLDAIEKCRSKPYDIVFMGVLMPEMDGIEATRAIRTLPGLRGKPWVVALTANAFKDAQNACRAAGMDAFLAKPFIRENLFQIVKGFLAREAADRTLFDAAKYERFAADIGAADAADVLATFAKDQARRIAKLKAAPAPAMSDLVNEAHSAKSSARTLGFLRLGDAAEDIELKASELSDAELRARIEDFERVTAQSMRSVNLLLSDGCQTKQAA